MVDDLSLAELERLKGDLNAIMPKLSKWRVEELSQLISKYYMRRWKKRRFAKYGAINKGFTESELKTFLSVITEPRFKLLFSYQAFLGLRVGEVCKLNMKDFDFRIRELRVHTEKAHTLDTLLVPQFLFDETLEFVKEHTKEIDEAEGYIFYTNKEKKHCNTSYINLNYVRRIFRYYISLTGLDEVYDITEESQEGRAIRKLHRLTTHSLRHYAITTFNRAVNGNITTTKAFARHRDLSSTQVYVHVSKEEMYNGIDKAFSKQNFKTKEKIQNNF